MKARLFYVSIVVLIAQNPVTAQWYQQSFPRDEYLWKVSFADENTGWIVGQDSVYKTTDGGLSWNIQNTPGGACFALKAVDQQRVVYSAGVGIRLTTDGGATWALVDSLHEVDYFDFEFVTTEIGYAAGATSPGYNSILRKTTDGGASWVTVSIIPQTVYGEFEAISFVEELTGWGITYGGTIYHTTDGGQTWDVSDSSGIRNMRDIDFIDYERGWAVGGIGGTMRLWRTTDGGNSWIKVEQEGSSLREITMMDAEVGWFAGVINGPPFIARTDDGGVAWTTQDLYPDHNDGFESICMVNENIGWAVTCCGRVYKTTNGGITSVDEPSDLPGAFSLSQNYPNPFNPKTTIRFEIGDVGYVKLEIFDPLGRTMATLVDEELAPGSYTRSWDAAGVASGVYFYRLQAGSYVETRKLVLLR